MKRDTTGQSSVYLHFIPGNNVQNSQAAEHFQSVCAKYMSVLTALKDWMLTWVLRCEGGACNLEKGTKLFVPASLDKAAELVGKSAI